MPGKVIDRVGRVFGLVTVESRAGTDADGKTTWNVVCQCGQRRVVSSDSLTQRPPNTHIACKRAKWAEREKALLAERAQGR